MNAPQMTAEQIKEMQERAEMLAFEAQILAAEKAGRELCIARLQEKNPLTTIRAKTAVQSPRQ